MTGDRGPDLDLQRTAALRARLLRQIRTDRRRWEQRHRSDRPGGVRTRLVPLITTALIAAAVVAVTVGVLLTRHGQDPAGPPIPHVFNGRCAATIPDGIVTAAVGTPVRSPADQAVALGAGAPTTALDALGGLTCVWNPQQPSRQDQSGLLLTIAPAAVAPVRQEPTYCYASSAGGPDQTSCRFSFTADRLWYSGLLTTSNAGESATRHRLTALRTAATSAGKKPGAVVPLTARPSGTWRGPIDCTALTRTARLAEVLHDPGLTGQPGDGGSETPAAQAAADRRLAVTSCIAGTDGTGGPNRITPLQFTLYPAAAAVTRDRIIGDPTARHLTRDSDPVQIWVTRDDDGLATLHVLTGPNYLRLDAGTTPVSALQPAIAPLLHQLDRHRTQ